MALSDLLGLGLQIGSTVMGAGSQVARGEAAQAIGARRAAEQQYESKELEAEAASSRGVGLRAAQDQVRNAMFVNSAALARAAASGAGASDPTVMTVISRTAGEGAYRAALAMYEGEAQARLDLAKAGAMNFEARTNLSDAALAREQANMGAASTVLTGATRAMSLYQKYWAGPVAQSQPMPTEE